MPEPALHAAASRPIPLLARLIFASRWLQVPLYVGLILAQCVYVYHFWVELLHLIEAALGDAAALNSLIKSIGYQLPAIVKDGVIIGYEPPQLNETVIMLVVLALIDVVMISNLLIMVIVGGMGNTAGVVVAAIVLTLLNEALREFEVYRMIVFSLLLILLMILRPNGLLGGLGGLVRRFRPQRKA